MSQRISALDFSIKNSKFEAYANDEELISKIEKLKASKEQVKDYKLDVGKALKFNIALQIGLMLLPLELKTFSYEKEKRTNSNVSCA